MGGYVHVHASGVQKKETDSLGTGITGYCEQSCVGAGN